MNLNSDGTATNAARGEVATSSVSGKTRIVAKDNGDFAALNAVNNFITGGSVSRMSAAMDTYDREGSQAYRYHMIGNAHRDEMMSFMSGARSFGSSSARTAVGIDDVLKNPKLLQGKSLGQVQQALGNSTGWVNDVMRKSTRAEGWVLREMNSSGTNPTGRMIQYHPGTPRHFGGSPYWKVSTGPGGTIRIPQNP